jgi:hypothetical protein
MLLGVSRPGRSASRSDALLKKRGAASGHKNK